MNITNKIAPVIAAALVFSSAGFALAQTDTSVSGSASASVTTGGTGIGTSATMEARITTAKNHADQEIKRRIDMLNALNAKVQAMARVSASEKTDISSTISTQVSALSSLQTKIDADTDITTLRTDIHSIAQSYRIFLLVIPRGRIDVAADKIDTAAAKLTDLAGKLDTRISEASGAADSLHAQLNDMNKMIADAQTQANAAVTAVASLQPDNGDKTVESANTAAIKDARTKIKAALADLKTARQDAGTIVKALMQMGDAPNASVHAAAEASSSTQ